MRFIAISLALLLGSVAAQAQGLTPAELALNINQAVDNMAGALTSAQKQLAADQQEIAALNKQVADLKAKAAPKKDGK